MHIDLSLRFLLAISIVTATENLGGCLFEPCRKNLGVYYLAITASQNLTIYEVVTFRPDGTFDTIDSVADGNLFSSGPSFGAYSSAKGVWKCNGRNGIQANTVAFFYPTPVLPRYASKAEFKLQFTGNDRLTGTLITQSYDLASTQNQDQSQWIKLFPQSNYNLEGYKLFDRCVN